MYRIPPLCVEELVKLIVLTGALPCSGTVLIHFLVMCYGLSLDLFVSLPLRYATLFTYVLCCWYVCEARHCHATAVGSDLLNLVSSTCMAVHGIFSGYSSSAALLVLTAHQLQLGVVHIQFLFCALLMSICQGISRCVREDCF